ncbi:MAG: DnaD domain protein, partial [Clostridia bacterium]|nr:DnaD domain protein [Clostridia bacterium]
TEDIAEFLDIPVSEAEDALKYWTTLGILMNDSEPASAPKVQAPAVVRAEKPTRSDVARRGAEDKNIMFLLREAQLKFGRNLKSNEASTLVWLYDDMGMDVSVILIVVQYAVSEGRGNISFIEKTAIDWLNKGVASALDAEGELAEAARKKNAWNIVRTVFGMEKRLPSDKESKYANCWVNEWKMSKELLKAAYDACVDTKLKLSMSYVNGILEGWHKAGVEKPEEIEKKTAKPQKEIKNGGKKGGNKGGKNGGATYDLDLFEKMLNSDE